MANSTLAGHSSSSSSRTRPSSTARARLAASTASPSRQASMHATTAATPSSSSSTSSLSTSTACSSPTGRPSARPFRATSCGMRPHTRSTGTTRAPTRLTRARPSSPSPGTPKRDWCGCDLTGSCFLLSWDFEHGLVCKAPERRARVLLSGRDGWVMVLHSRLFITVLRKGSGLGKSFLPVTRSLVLHTPLHGEG